LLTKKGKKEGVRVKEEERTFDSREPHFARAEETSRAGSTDASAGGKIRTALFHCIKVAPLDVTSLRLCGISSNNL
jgi:hypothetical protein